MYRHATSLTFLALLVTLHSAPLQALPPDLDRYIEDVRKEWGVVGLAVAVVKDGKVVYARGFGERELSSGERVDENTLFAIGSNSKAFTAAAMGILVDEKKVGWDDRVTEHLSWFELYDPYVTREITVRDLLSHRSGLGRRGDANWYATDFDRREVLRRIRFLPPNSSFRSEAGYQNTMFLAAGGVVESVSGESWDDFVSSRLFRPLGMTRSRTSVRELEGMTNVAHPHERIDAKVVPVPHRNIDNVAPAGSILSSVSDMTRWMLLMLGEGELDGHRVISQESAAELFKPNIIYPLPVESKELFPSTHFSTYGLGWGLRDYRGRFIATHTGGIDGMLSQVLLAPEEELGIVVLTNTSPTGSLAHASVTYHILDGFLAAGEETDWRARFRELGARQDELREERESKRVESRVSGTTPSLGLDRYAGTYEDEMYGEILVSLEDGHLVVRRHRAWVGDLEHWHYDTFLVRWRDRVMGETRVTFRLSLEGKVSSLEVEDVETFDAVLPVAPTAK
ncbi:MAG TPA: serine hydrolase [Vicinamibacteria bacterium]|nr:serine hydrolase [Vicinamibacteria bacterium]